MYAGLVISIFGPNIISYWEGGLESETAVIIDLKSNWEIYTSEWSTQERPFLFYSSYSSILIHEWLNICFLESCIFLFLSFFNYAPSTKFTCSMCCKLIAKVGRLQGQRLGQDPSLSIRHLFQRLSVSLWRGNAAMWGTRQPTWPPAIDGVVWLFHSNIIIFIYPFLYCLVSFLLSHI